MNRNNRIYLTGFMTSGKSTIGPILANVLGWDFYDLDKVIEKDQKKSVVEIFAEHGELYFRELETSILKKLIQMEDTVISLGGGTMVNEVNFELLKNSGKIIYLKVSPDILYERLKHKIDRPLFRDIVLSDHTREDFIERINEHLKSREYFYEKADLVINTDSTPVGITVDNLAKKVKRLVNAKN